MDMIMCARRSALVALPLSVDLCRSGTQRQAYNTTNVNVLHWVVVIVSSVPSHVVEFCSLRFTSVDGVLTWPAAEHEGRRRIYALTYRGVDRAGNAAVATALVRVEQQR